MKKINIIAGIGFAAILCAAGVSLGSYAVETATSNISITVNVTQIGGLTDDGNTTIGNIVSNLDPGQVNTSLAVHKVYYGTNNAKGFTVKLYGTSNGTNKNSLYAGSEDKEIKALTGDALVQNVNSSTQGSGWGVKTNTTSTPPTDAGSGWKPVAASESDSKAIIMEENAGSATGKTVYILYGISVPTDTASGTYEGQVTYAIKNKE